MLISYKGLALKNLLAKQNYMRIKSDFLFHFSGSEAPFISPTGVLALTEFQKC